MVEAVLAAGIVGGLLVAALTLVGSVAAERRIAAERNTGQMLVIALAEEIAALPAENSVTITTSDPGRATLTDARSFDGYTESPPTDRAGVPIQSALGWTRSVEVTEVTSADPEGVETADGGVFRVRITAQINSRVAGEMTLFRSAAGDEAIQ